MGCKSQVIKRTIITAIVAFLATYTVMNYIETQYYSQTLLLNTTEPLIADQIFWYSFDVALVPTTIVVIVGIILYKKCKK